MIVPLPSRLVSLLRRRQQPRSLGVSVRPSCPLQSSALGGERAWRRLCWWSLLVSRELLSRRFSVLCFTRCGPAEVNRWAASPLVFHPARWRIRKQDKAGDVKDQLSVPDMFKKLVNVTAQIYHKLKAHPNRNEACQFSGASLISSLMCECVAGRFPPYPETPPELGARKKRKRK